MVDIITHSTGLLTHAVGCLVGSRIAHAHQHSTHLPRRRRRRRRRRASQNGEEPFLLILHTRRRQRIRRESRFNGDVIAAKTYRVMM